MTFSEEDTANVVKAVAFVDFLGRKVRFAIAFSDESSGVYGYFDALLATRNTAPLMLNPRKWTWNTWRVAHGLKDAHPGLHSAPLSIEMFLIQIGDNRMEDCSSQYAAGTVARPHRQLRAQS